jgi:ADP-ribose pyrophosphatase YjhB (NUDIX family)
MQVCRSRLSVNAWIERDGFVLLNKIALGNADGGRWTLPGGGVQWGEHPEDCLLRELHAKTGLKGTIKEHLGVSSTVFDPNEFNGFTSMHLVRLVYRVEAKGTPKVADITSSASDAAWLPLSNVSDLSIVDLVELGRSLANG